MKHQKIIPFIFLFLLLAFNPARGQSSIKAVVDKNKIMLGEVFQLSIEVAIGNGGKEKFNSPDTIPHFEFVESPQLDTTSIDNGISIKAIYKLTSFDSGRWNISSFSLSSRLRTDSIPIDVVFSEFDPNQEYHDIKDIIEVDPPKKKIKWWWFVVGGILLAVILYTVLKKKPVITPAPVKSTANPYEEALRQLNELKAAAVSSRQFHSRITDIFRTYVYKRKGILSLQKTTADLVVQLKELEMDKIEFEKLAQSLRLSDFVKFAKYEPGREDNEAAWITIRNAIEWIERIEKKPTAPV